MDAADVVRQGVERAFTATRSALDGLTDDEYFWEPVAACWSVRRRSTTTDGWGTGAWVCEGDWPPPDPPPVTTLAWRLAHLCAWTDVYRSHAFEDGAITLATLEVPDRASQALAWLSDSQRSFLSCLQSVSAADLDEERPIHWGQLFPLVNLIRVIEVEHIHHGAEMSLLRDLRRGTAQSLPFVP